MNTKRNETNTLSKLSNRFHAWTKGWLILALFLVEGLFNAIILPGVQQKLIAASGGTGPIDLLFFYTPETVYTMVASYGEAGRAMYRNFELIGDIIYPLVYTLFFSLLISWLFQRGFKPDSAMQKLNVIPVGTLIFDLLENIFIVIMLSIHPAQPALVAWMGAGFTLAKWSFFGVSLVLVLVGLGKAAMNKFRKQDM